MTSTRSAVALLALSLLACGKKDESAESSESTGGEAELSPEEATTIVGGLVAKEMCKPEGYFASCGTFQPGECEATTVAAFKGCIDANPEWINQLEDDAVSQALGVCTAKGALLKVAGEGRLSIEGRCADPDKFP